MFSSFDIPMEQPWEAVDEDGRVAGLEERFWDFK